MRNPFVANFCAKMMPYRGFGSGIIRALREEPNLEFVNEPERMQFVSVINRAYDDKINDPINVAEGINGIETLILAFLEKKPGVKGGEIIQFLQKGTSTIERYLKSLKEKNLIEYRGSRKTGGYFKK